MFSRTPLWNRVHAKLFGYSPIQNEAAASLLNALAAPHTVRQVHLSFLNGSIMAIGYSPTFRFNPEGHALYRTAVGEVVEVQGSRLRVVFDVGQHCSPPMDWSTTFLQALWPLRIPALPPGISIEMDSKELQGWIDLSSGEVDLYFVSEFDNRALGAHISAEPLQISSRMTNSCLLSGQVFQACGERINPETACATLVALSRVPVTGDRIQDTLLALPTDALSILKVQLRFQLYGPHK